MPSLRSLLVAVLLLTAASRFGAAAATMPPPPSGALAGERFRVIVSTDIGGSDPDDFQSMVHFLVYADVFDTEGLISSPPHAGRREHLLESVAAYALDYPQLRKRSERYPTPDHLRALCKQGAVDPAPPEGFSSPTEGSDWIIARAHAEDPRPLWILVWGSITDVAQALHDDPTIRPKLRVYFISSWNRRMDQAARDYIIRQHPDLWLIEADTTFRGMYVGGNQDADLGNREFLARHVQDHGALGNLLMSKKSDIKMGDTPSVLYLLRGAAEDPESPSWGGAFIRPDPSKPYWTDNPDPALREGNYLGARTVNRWREQYLRDWQERMNPLPETTSASPCDLSGPLVLEYATEFQPPVIIRIATSGALELHLPGPASFGITNTLSHQERIDLSRALEQTGLMSTDPASRKPVNWVGHVGLVVKYKSRVGELYTLNAEGAELLLAFADRWTAQAEVTRSAIRDLKSYPARQRLSPRLGGGDLPRPMELVFPIQEVARRSEVPTRVFDALQALAWVQDPQSWSDFIRQLLEEPTPKRRLLYRRAVGGLLSDAGTQHHREALLAICLQIAEDLHRETSGLRNSIPEERTIYYRAIDALRDAHYTEAVPFLSRLFDAQTSHHVSGTQQTLAYLGLAGLDALAERFHATNLNQRLAAVTVMESAFRLRPGVPGFATYPDQEYQALRERYSTVLRLQLTRLSESDPADSVRNRASAAIAAIDHEIDQWEDRQTPCDGEYGN